jgi:hypothetical protein
MGLGMLTLHFKGKQETEKITTHSNVMNSYHWYQSAPYALHRQY